MTNTALKNKEIQTREKEIRSKEKIAEADRREKARMHAIDDAREKGKAKGDWIMRGVDSGIKGLRGIGSLASAFNDASWYKSIPELASVTTRLPTYRQVGEQIVGSPTSNRTVPYVMGINYIPSWQGRETTNGDVSIQASPLNLAASRFQSYLRARNSRVGSYEPGDLFQMLLQEVDVFASLEFARKVIGLALYKDANVKDSSTNLILACGFKPKDLVDKRANYVAKFNQLVAYANENLAVPDDLPYVKRQIFLARAFYKDCKIRQGQVYITRKAWWYQYDEANAVLDVNMADSLIDMETYLSLIEDQISRVQYSAALQTMLADIRAGVSTFVTLPGMPLEYVPEPSVVDEVLYQILNADIMCFASYVVDYDLSIDDVTPGTYTECGNYLFPSTLTHKSFALMQNASGLLYSGYGQAGTAQRYVPAGDSGTPTSLMRACLEANLTGYPHVLNFYHDEITEDDILVASRLKIPNYEAYVAAGTPKGQVIRSAGDVVITNITLVYPNNVNVGSGTITMISTGFTSIAPFSFEYSQIMGLVNFDWCPKFCIHNYNLTDTSSPEQGARLLIHEWGNIIELPNDNLIKINEMCLQSLMYSPFNGVSQWKVK